MVQEWFRSGSGTEGHDALSSGSGIIPSLWRSSAIIRPMVVLPVPGLPRVRIVRVRTRVRARVRARVRTRVRTRSRSRERETMGCG